MTVPSPRAGTWPGTATPPSVAAPSPAAAGGVVSGAGPPEDAPGAWVASVTGVSAGEPGLPVAGSTARASSTAVLILSTTDTVCSTGTPRLPVSDVPEFAWVAPTGSCTGGALTRDPAVVTPPSEPSGPPRPLPLLSIEDCPGVVWSSSGASTRVSPAVTRASGTNGPSWFTDPRTGGADSSGCPIESSGLSTPEDSGLARRASAA